MLICCPSPTKSLCEVVMPKVNHAVSNAVVSNFDQSNVNGGKGCSNPNNN